MTEETFNPDDPLFAELFAEAGWEDISQAHLRNHYEGIDFILICWFHLCPFRHFFCSFWRSRQV